MRSPRLPPLEAYPAIIKDLHLSTVADRTAKMRYLCRNDLYFLLRFVLNRKDVEGKSPSAKRWLFERIREVQKNPNGFLDLWAREHYKSSILTMGLTIQDILRGHGEGRETAGEPHTGHNGADPIHTPGPGGDSGLNEPVQGQNEAQTGPRGGASTIAGAECRGIDPLPSPPNFSVSDFKFEKNRAIAKSLKLRWRQKRISEEAYKEGIQELIELELDE